MAGGWGDEDAVVGDLVDAPGGGAEDEDLAGAGLEDHLLVQLAYADGFGAVGEEDAVEAAVGDGAAVEDGDALGAVARGEPVAGAVPGDAGAELGELVGGIEAGEHVEDAVEGVGAEVGEGSGAADEGEERGVGDSGGCLVVGSGEAGAAFGLGDGKRWVSDDGYDLLGEDVEGVAEEAGGFDVAGVHGFA